MEAGGWPEEVWSLGWGWSWGWGCGAGNTYHETPRAKNIADMASHVFKGTSMPWIKELSLLTCMFTFKFKLFNDQMNPDRRFCLTQALLTK